MQACKSKDEKTANYTAVNLSKDDRTFLMLKDSAQLHLHEFTGSLQTHGLDDKNYLFIVKSDFVDGDIHEHMWSKVNLLSDTLLKGSLIDSPFTVKNIKTNQKVSVGLHRVEDWVIYDKLHHKKLGDYSSKYLESKIDQ